MTIRIKVGDRSIPFRLDQQHWRWHSLEEPEEGDFPLIAVVDGRRLRALFGWNVCRRREVNPPAAGSYAPEKPSFISAENP